MTQRPDPDDTLQHLCLDKGYDYPDLRELALELGYRWEKRLDRYQAFLHFACAIIVWRAVGGFG
jgi:hypothetical protein